MLTVVVLVTVCQLPPPLLVDARTVATLKRGLFGVSLMASVALDRLGGDCLRDCVTAWLIWLRSSQHAVAERHGQI